ncbi:universal stress protein [Natronorubrum sp. FCH18a]|uniref:universal stress protein n=1 Tax=Natronorubrum sp. FCH18a TaxID=3447018 RepID=UPI003F51A369
MTTHVLVPYDDSEFAHAALEYALTEYSEGAITILYVFEPADGYGGTNTAVVSDEETGEETPDEDGDSVLGQARKRAIEQDRQLSTARAAGDPPRAIHQYATEHDVDHIVVGGRDRSGASKLLEQNLADGVIRGSPVPVTVV